QAGTYTVTVKDNIGCAVTVSVIVTEPDALAVSSTQTNVSCFTGADGTIALNVMGGTAPYQYKWSNGLVTANINQLKAGLYNVTVRDVNGCSITKSIVITEPGDVPAPLVQDQA